MWIMNTWRHWRDGAPQRKTDRAISYVRRRSYWLAKRPFGNKYDGDANGGYFAGCGPQVNGEEEALAKRRAWR